MTTQPRTASAAGVSLSERDIAGFVVERFLPGVAAGELDPEYDLLATAVIDSLAVLHVAAWLEQRYGIELADAELTGRNFRTVRAIRLTAERAAATGGGQA
ncbi:acyl carrier protein [Streptomyces bullii]|uniref:Acyl carrier protein n=1 Tax=Streptomyces bullii TaxID=349910 RepID=A0ABW0US53_9ACTN